MLRISVSYVNLGREIVHFARRCVCLHRQALLNEDKASSVVHMVSGGRTQDALARMRRCFLTPTLTYLSFPENLTHFLALALTDLSVQEIAAGANPFRTANSS